MPARIGESEQIAKGYFTLLAKSKMECAYTRIRRIRDGKWQRSGPGCLDEGPGCPAIIWPKNVWQPYWVLIAHWDCFGESNSQTHSSATRATRTTWAPTLCSLESSIFRVSFALASVSVSATVSVSGLASVSRFWLWVSDRQAGWLAFVSGAFLCLALIKRPICPEIASAAGTHNSPGKYLHSMQSLDPPLAS